MAADRGRRRRGRSRAALAPTTALLIVACLVACGLGGCRETVTVEFQIMPSCPGESCDTVDVSCVSHVLVEYLDAARTDSEGNPLSLSRVCRPVSPKDGVKLCGFGSEVGPLPPMPGSRPFWLKLEGFSRGRGASDCHADDRVFGGVTETALDLDAKVPPVVRVPIRECSSARCAGIQGQVIDLLNSGGVAEDLTLEYGYVTLGGRFEPTTRHPVNVPAAKAGLFAIVSDEGLRPSSYGCRAYRVNRGGHFGLFCDPEPSPRFPIADALVRIASRAVVDRVEDLLAERIDRPRDGGFVIGRVISKNAGVEGAAVTRQPGDCDPNFVADKCVWYPEDGLQGRRSDGRTGKSGLFISAYRTGINPNEAFGVRVETQPGRQFLEAFGYFVKDHVFVVEIREAIGQ